MDELLPRTVTWLYCADSTAFRQAFDPSLQAEAVPMVTVRTSDTHPLKIGEVHTGNGRGLIGVTFAPGKVQADAQSGAWRRDLAKDLNEIAKWGARAVVTLLEPHELTSLQIASLGTEVRSRGLDWLHLPIRDGDIPGPDFERAWPSASQRIRSVLAARQNVLVHCKGGLGRAGLVSARLLVELGFDIGRAIADVRQARPGAIENPRQAAWAAQTSKHAGFETPDERANLVRVLRKEFPDYAEKEIEALCR